MTAHPWHGIELGRKYPALATAVIETPKGSNTQYVLDHASGLLRLKELLPTMARYPANWGFFPRTLSSDGDPLDVIVLGREPAPPLSLVQVRVLGGLRLQSKKKEPEDKLVAVPLTDPEYRGIRRFRDLPRHFVLQLEEFFSVYKARDDDSKQVVKTFGRTRAQEKLSAAAEAYRRKFLTPAPLPRAA